MASYKVWLTRWRNWCLLIYCCSLMSLFVSPSSHANFFGFDPVLFYGEGRSYGRTVSILFHPTSGCNIITQSDVTISIPDLGHEHEDLLVDPVTGAPLFNPHPTLVENIEWPVFFLLATSLVTNIVTNIANIPVGATHAEFTFLPEDALFGGAGAVKYSYKHYEILMLGNQLVYRLSFTGKDSNGILWAIYIDFFKNPEGADDLFTIHAFHLYEGGQLIDGFYTEAYLNAVQPTPKDDVPRDNADQDPTPEPPPPKKNKPDEGNRGGSVAGRKRDASHLWPDQGYYNGGGTWALNGDSVGGLVITLFKLYVTSQLIPDLSWKYQQQVQP